MRKYLDILGIGYGLSKEEINKAYKKIAMKYHPDRNHGFKEEAEKKMKILNKARDYVLNNYDEYISYNGDYSRNKKEEDYKKGGETGEELKNNNKIIRLKKVLFFIGLFMLPFITNWLGIDYDNSNWYISNFIYYFIPYILFVEFIYRIINYINKGENKGFLNLNFLSNETKINFLKTFKTFVLMTIIIYFFIRILFGIFYSDISNQDCLLTNSGTSELNQDGKCKCISGYKMSDNGICETEDFLNTRILENNTKNDINIIDDNTYSDIIMQDVNLRQNPGIDSKKLTVLRKGDNITVYSQKLFDNELWYEVDGRNKHGWINYIAFEKQEITNNINLDVAPVDILLDCGEGGQYNDYLNKCLCDFGYGKGNDGKCYK